AAELDTYVYIVSYFVIIIKSSIVSAKIIVDLQSFFIHYTNGNKETGLVIASRCREVMVLHRTVTHDDIPPVRIRKSYRINHTQCHPLVNGPILEHIVGPQCIHGSGTL